MRIFQKSVEKIQVSLKYEKNTRCITNHSPTQGESAAGLQPNPPQSEI